MHIIVKYWSDDEDCQLSIKGKYETRTEAEGALLLIVANFLGFETVEEYREKSASSAEKVEKSGCYYFEAEPEGVNYWEILTV